MKKFFAVLLAVVLVFAGFLAVRNQGLGFTAQASAEETGADDDELVAVITAALMAYAAESGSDKTLVVRNIRKTSAWSKAGRNAQLAARL